uniref:Uncharacterized protein n=1 Tax=Anguilla anguilla TaxID=7936 RepID=A0A0E9TDJ8_ANGAN
MGGGVRSSVLKCRSAPETLMLPVRANNVWTYLRPVMLH